MSPAAGVRDARTALPETLRERARILLARRLEARQRRSAAVRGAAIVFHAVKPRAGDRKRELDPPLEVDRLDAAVGYLSRHYAPVRAAELPVAARAREPGDRLPIAVTFDDDLPSHREHALPIFKRHGAIATAFLCGARSPFWWHTLQVAVDTGAIAPSGLPHLPTDSVRWALGRRPGAIGRLAEVIEGLPPAHRDDVTNVLGRAVAEPRSLLDPEGAAALAAAGWEIGFHTREHYLLTTLDDDRLRTALERRPVGCAGTLPCTLAYPHGKATAREANAARRAGYVAAFTGYGSVYTEGADDFLIGRLQPDTATLGRFALHLARALSIACLDERQ